MPKYHLTGAELIARERQRQIEVEGYTPLHDDKHQLGELADAANCYVTVASAMARGATADEFPASMFDGYADSLVDWPWEEEAWNPENDVVKMLTKAGALIAAEIDRHHRKLRAGIAA